MRKSRLLLILLIFSGAAASAQTLPSKEISGRVYSESGDVAATHIINTTALKATISDNEGYFSIAAKLYDTLVFSAVQYKRKTLVVTQAVFDSKLLYVPMEESITELDEVVVMPYNLTGNMAIDLGRTDIGPVVTASTLGLPNANVKTLTQAERELYSATANPFMGFDPLINAITGRTKMLKQRIARNRKYERTQRVRAFYADSLYTSEFRIPKEKIDDFMYYCEVDPEFQSLVDSHDRFKIWEYMRKKSVVYKENNGLD